jgi:dolichol-phosphate mannosyltransferase
VTVEPNFDTTWIVLPTYNERENLVPMLEAITVALPGVHTLVVDDGSPDGTGELADEFAADDPSVEVLHRTAKEGLGAAYRAGFERVLSDPSCEFVVQMDCDFSHDPRDLPRLLERLKRGADLALGSRYVRGGGTIGWGLRRKIISRGGSLFAGAVLLLPYRDLTGGFKAWRSPLLRRVLGLVTETHGYGFQIETTWHAHRLGARTVQVPIIFRDRVAGSSKMSGDIVREALLLVLRLRLKTMRTGGASRSRPD